MKNKNQELLDDFVKYCADNPSLRFWQALKGWAKADKVIIQRGPVAIYNDEVLGQYDTYYWEGKNE